MLRPLNPAQIRIELNRACQEAEVNYLGMLAEHCVLTDGRFMVKVDAELQAKILEKPIRLPEKTAKKMFSVATVNRVLTVDKDAEHVTFDEMRERPRNGLEDFVPFMHQRNFTMMSIAQIGPCEVNAQYLRLVHKIHGKKDLNYFATNQRMPVHIAKGGDVIAAIMPLAETK